MTEFEKALELKPCPFCGSEPSLEWSEEFETRFVFCGSCQTRGPWVDDDEPKSEAARLWNTRASLSTHKAAPVSDGVVERARELLAAELPGVVGDALRERGDVVGSLIGAAPALRAIERALSGLDEAKRALEPFARCPTHGKHGGPFVIASAVYEDMTNGGSAPREAYWHAEDFERARTVADKLRSAS